MIKNRVNTHKNETLRRRELIQPIKLLDSLISTEYRQFERQQLQRVRINYFGPVELYLYHLGVRLVSLLSPGYFNLESDFSSRVFSSLSQAATSVTKKYIYYQYAYKMHSTNRRAENDDVKTRRDTIFMEKRLVNESVTDATTKLEIYIFSDQQKAVKAAEILSGGVVLL